MLLESSIFSGNSSLPDVNAGLKPPQGIASTSALAAIHSGQDYTRAIQASALRELANRPQDSDYTLSPKDAQRRQLQSEMRQVMNKAPRARPVVGSYQVVESALPGMVTGNGSNTGEASSGTPTLFPDSPNGTSASDTSNILAPIGGPPPEDVWRAPLLPAPLPAVKSTPFSVADIFKGVPGMDPDQLQLP